MKLFHIADEKRTIIEHYIMPANGVNCKQVLNMCRPVMEQIKGEKKLPEQWLDFLYRAYLSLYFPDNFHAPKAKDFQPCFAFYFEVLRELIQREKEELTFDPCRDFLYLSDEERKDSEIAEEYERFWNSYQANGLYEFMRIAREVTPFDTLGHIAGVHHVAMHVARQVKQTDIPVDLALVSAAAIIHDIGKFGCRPIEAGRVPYLHYYYTEQFSKRFHFDTIGHIAANHSTWDLELENLSIENLILIYADFRVKSVVKNRKEVVCFWSLDESYNVILQKLDNVDEKKRRRYRKVFYKLKDFEHFLTKNGISVDLHTNFSGAAAKKEVSLLEMPELAEEFKFCAIASNISVMHNMERKQEFIGLLDEAKSEKNWRNVRIYLNILDEYSTYMSAEQKEAVIHFLYEMLMHRDGDIRRHAAKITGRLIVSIAQRYQKEVPGDVTLPKAAVSSADIWADVLRKMLIPDHKITEQHKRWIGFAMKSVFTTILDGKSSSVKKECLAILTDYYRHSADAGLLTFLLMDCSAVIPYDMCSRGQRECLMEFAEDAIKQNDWEIFTAVLRFWNEWLKQGWKPNPKERSCIERHLAAEETTPVGCRYLMDRIYTYIGKTDREKPFFTLDSRMIAGLLMENQRIEVPWIFKQVNLEILDKACKDGKISDVFQLGVHFANMLQTSDRIVIKYLAGDNLINLMPRLANTEKYELAMELLRGLEIGEYSTSKYIPGYLGQLFFSLEEYSRQKLVERFQAMIDSINPNVAIVTLDTLGMILGNYVYLEGERLCLRASEKMRIQLEGLILRGMAHYVDEVSLEAFWVVGHSIFGSKTLPLEGKAAYFLSMSRKLRTIMGEESNHLRQYNYAAVFNHIYRFLSDYTLDKEKLLSEERKKIAFFPGTFDPFSLGHKAIVKEMLKLGFCVYLALDEFSWSKKVQPYKIRQKIVNMSIADLKDAYLFPENIVVNLANPKDLQALNALFSGRKVYLAVGSDVIEHASAYKKPAEEYSVHTFPHIVFNRKGGENFPSFSHLIHKEIYSLTLPKGYEDIRSTRIRENIDLNRDISNLVDANVQNYIYEYGLYTREPIFKLTMTSRAIDTFYQPAISAGFMRELTAGLLKEEWNHGRGSAASRLPFEQVVATRDEKQYGQLMGAVLFHPVSFHKLYQECFGEKITAYLRKHCSGRIAVITGIYEREETEETDNGQIVITEMLAKCLEQEYTYSLCYRPGRNRELLLRQGFIPLPVDEDCLLVDLRNPVLLFGDARMCLKEPFRSDEKIRTIMARKRIKLQESLATLYPGNLVFCLESDVVNNRVIKMIAKENKTQVCPSPLPVLGENMCVPFGKILRGMLVANCVTKALAVEKMYEPDMSGFAIREYPYFADLTIQVKTMKSFQRPVILVDDLYHKGYRIEGIDPILKEEQINVKKIIVGAMSGNGRDLAYWRKKTIDCAYYIPNIRAWFMESGFYPFIGGESVRKRGTKAENAMLLPSISYILPYQIPHFLSDIKLASFYYFSEICLSNTREIMGIIERVYQDMTGRKLTVRRLGEVMAEPRYPDSTFLGNFNKMATDYLYDEEQRLKRFASLLSL